MTRSDETTEARSKPPSVPRPRAGAYSWYALFVLVVCYLFNYIDRNILSILAEDVKADLGLDDAQIGFLYGTAFAVFYAVFGIPFGRLADAWVRKNLIAIGIFFWSAMTALTGTARSFPMLASYRVGVGVGEASLSPAAYSMIVDLFPQRLRATALALYSSGIYFGAGIGFFLGGWIVDTWKSAFPHGGAPLGLKAWQAAFLVVGLPGVVMALWVWSLREPAKGGRDMQPPGPSRRPEPLQELAAVIPPLTLAALWRAGAGGWGLLFNLTGAAALALLAWVVTLTAGDGAQWTALAVGLYAAFSWGQGLRLRDPETFQRVLRNRAFLYSCVGFASLSFVTNGLAFWTAPFLLRSHDTTPTQVGALMGIGAALGGWAGVTLGGLLSDRLKMRRATGRVDTGLLTVILSVPAFFLMVRAQSLALAFASFLVLVAVVSLWIGPAAASVNELVVPRTRATASAIYLLLNTFIGFALGPFAVGKTSDALLAAGQSPGHALGNAMLLSMLFWSVSVGFLWRARSYVGPTEARLAETARRTSP